MTWRVPSLGTFWAEHKGERNRLAFKGLIESGKAKGCLAFDDERPIGWCSFGPRDEFDYLRRSRLILKTELSGVWSITCFFIPASYQRRGLSGLLVDAACDYARQAGAAWMEAYPSVPKTGGTIPPAFAHTGLPGPFLRRGFAIVECAGARLVLRKSLRSEQAFAAELAVRFP